VQVAQRSVNAVGVGYAILLPRSEVGRSRGFFAGDDVTFGAYKLSVAPFGMEDSWEDITWFRVEGANGKSGSSTDDSGFSADRLRSRHEVNHLRIWFVEQGERPMSFLNLIEKSVHGCSSCGCRHGVITAI
jgi:hypothetical protein